MAELLNFTGTTILPDDPIQSLEKAKMWGLERVIIAGWTEGGKFHFGGSHCEIGEGLLLLEMCKAALIDCAKEQSRG